MHWSQLIALINWNLFAWFGIVHVTRCGQIQAILIVQTRLLVWGSLLRQYLIQTNRNRALKLFRGHFWVNDQTEVVKRLMLIDNRDREISFCWMWKKCWNYAANKKKSVLSLVWYECAKSFIQMVQKTEKNVFSEFFKLIYCPV